MQATLDEPFTPVADALDRLEAAVSPLSGIVRELSPAMWAADEPRLHAFSCELASSARTTGCATTAYSGSAHLDRDRARAGAIGEALERYAATFVPDGLVVARAAELGGDAVSPDSYALFHERQFVSGFPFARFTPRTKLSWVEGFALGDGRPALLPAQLVYLRPLHHSEQPIGYPTSNGLACGPTLVEAILAGLLELVERDAMMIAWSNRLALPLLAWEEGDVGSIDASVFAPTGLRYSSIDASGLLGIPVGIGIVHGAPGERAALALGAGCALRVEDAWRTSLAEAFSVLRWLRGLLHEEPTRRVVRTEDVRTLEDHMVFFGRPERAGEIAFLEASRVRRDVGDVLPVPNDTPREAVAEIVRRLARAGVSAYAADVTSPDVEELGLKVARVLAPELCALDVFGSAPYRGGVRRYRAACDAGLSDRPLSYEELNPLPHPYP